MFAKKTKRELPYLLKYLDSAMILEIELRCFLFPFLILEMFVLLWRPPVLNPTNCEAKETHTYLGEVLASGVEHFLKNKGEQHTLGAQMQNCYVPTNWT